jgi:hypothetical protein
MFKSFHPNPQLPCILLKSIGKNSAVVSLYVLMIRNAQIGFRSPAPPLRTLQYPHQLPKGASAEKRDHRAGRATGKPSDVIQQMKAQLLKDKAAAVDVVVGARNPNGAIRLQHPLALSNPLKVRVIPSLPISRRLTVLSPSTLATMISPWRGLRRLSTTRISTAFRRTDQC